MNQIPYLALIPYAAVALGLLLTLALFVNLKWEMRRNQRRERKRVDALLLRLEESSPPASEPVFIPVAVEPGSALGLQSGLNLHRRIHALRLLRKGEDAAHIAAALGIPRAEADLLIRVHSLPEKLAAKEEKAEKVLAAAGD
jgi:hypothetical protein